jgi:microcystin-dependent protein
MDQFLAEIRVFPYSFAPRGWALCDGQLLPIAQNTALFSLLGTMYGGDGRSTFALPDLRGRAPMMHGQGTGLTPHYQGEQGGSETVTLRETEIPAHAHGLGAHAADPADVAIPNANAVLAAADGAYQPNAGVPLHGSALAPAGADQPHNNLMPYLTFNFCIALQGIYPPRP